MRSSYKNIKKELINKIVKTVDKSPSISRRARTAYKVAKRSLLRVAAFGRHITSDRISPQNIYHASIQRTGSRWIRSVFSDPRIQQYTGLWTYPQHEYEIKDHHDSFPRFTFVPGLYISYEQYLRIHKPRDYKTIYVIRDPRNTIVSWYKSMKNTHKLVNDSVQKFRSKFTELNKKRGIMEAIKYYQVKITFMREWYMQSKGDPKIRVVRFEDITENPKNELKKILRWCGLSVPKKTIKKVAKKNSKSEMIKRDKKRRSGGESDYGKGKTDWRNEFDDEHIEKFKEVHGNTAEMMGY